MSIKSGTPPKAVWVGRIRESNGERDVVREEADTGEVWVKGPFLYRLDETTE